MWVLSSFFGGEFQTSFHMNDENGVNEIIMELQTVISEYSSGGVTCAEHILEAFKNRNEHECGFCHEFLGDMICLEYHDNITLK